MHNNTPHVGHTETWHMKTEKFGTRVVNKGQLKRCSSSVAELIFADCHSFDRHVSYYWTATMDVGLQLLWLVTDGWLLNAVIHKRRIQSTASCSFGVTRASASTRRRRRCCQQNCRSSRSSRPHWNSTTRAFPTNYPIGEASKARLASDT